MNTLRGKINRLDDDIRGAIGGFLIRLGSRITPAVVISRAGQWRWEREKRLRLHK